MGDDPDGLTSHSCKNDSFHKIPPYLPFIKGGETIPPFLKGRCEKIQDSKPGRGDIGKNVERLPFPVLFTKTLGPWAIDNLETFMTIKINTRFLHFWRYSPVWATVPQFFQAFRGMKGDY
jgi:hypothetical protein